MRSGEVGFHPSKGEEQNPGFGSFSLQEKIVQRTNLRHLLRQVRVGRRPAPEPPRRAPGPVTRVSEDLIPLGAPPLGRGSTGRVKGVSGGTENLDL